MSEVHENFQCVVCYISIARSEIVGDGNNLIGDLI